MNTDQEPGFTLLTARWLALGGAAGVAVSLGLAQFGVQGPWQGVALGNAVKQPLPEALAPWINPVWLAAPREFLLGALQMAEQFAPSPDGVMAWIAPLVWTGWALGAAVVDISAK